jgi:hypothetical protein
VNKRNLQILIRDLEFLLTELKSEVYSDPESYLDKSKIKSVSNYIDQNDDDGDPD